MIYPHNGRIDYETVTEVVRDTDTGVATSGRTWVVTYEGKVFIQRDAFKARGVGPPIDASFVVYIPPRVKWLSRAPEIGMRFSGWERLFAHGNVEGEHVGKIVEVQHFTEHLAGTRIWVKLLDEIGGEQ